MEIGELFRDRNLVPVSRKRLFSENVYLFIPENIRKKIALAYLKNRPERDKNGH